LPSTPDHEVSVDLERDIAAGEQAIQPKAFRDGLRSIRRNNSFNASFVTIFRVPSPRSLHPAFANAKHQTSQSDLHQLHGVLKI
jgi:hypothetical protein